MMINHEIHEENLELLVNRIVRELPELRGLVG